MARAGERRLAPGPLERFAASALVAVGMPADHAATAAAAIVAADRRGQPGHGVARLASYVRRLAGGVINPRARITTDRESAVSALVDGDGGMGHVVATTAADLAIRKAADAGLAWVGTRRSGHPGAGGVYAARALEHDMIGLYLAVSARSYVAPWGGREPLLGTNPIALAIPAGREPAVQIDVATTLGSVGRIGGIAEEGGELPPGWVLDEHGASITDPHRWTEGTLAPIGGHKGYGLGLAVGLLAGVLNGAAFGRDQPSTEDVVTPSNAGQTFVALRPDLFGDPAAFAREMERHVRDLRSSAPLVGGDPVRVPGARAAEHGEQVRRLGVPVTETVSAQLFDLARRYDLDRGLLRSPPSGSTGV